MNHDSLWMGISNGEPGSYCSSVRMKALVFNQQGGDRFAITCKQALKSGDVLQFKVRYFSICSDPGL